LSEKMKMFLPPLQLYWARYPVQGKAQKKWPLSVAALVSTISA
jgi:hypothetical protein